MPPPAAAANAAEPYPLLLRPLLFEKVWGGRALERLGKVLPPRANIGESWELADMGATSASGAGGGAARSTIDNGPLAGRPIADAAAAWGDRMMGRRTLTTAGGFPLLIKFLDARENLSVQVHPSPAYAAANPHAHLKTECWYVLAAEPGAVIYKGVRPGVGAAELRAHTESGAIVNDLIAVPAAPGDCHNLPSGTVHALGAGVVVAEVQTPSDTTFRFFDWGRKGRELHLDQALACAGLPNTAPPATRLPPGERHARLVTTEYFTLDEHDIGPGDALAIGDGSGPAAVLVISGSASIGDLLSSRARVETTVGRTCLVPAFNTAWDSVVGGPDGCRVLIARLP